MGSSMAMQAGEMGGSVETRTQQQASEKQMQETLLVMDVVDEMRYRAAELDKLGAADDASLKTRLAEIYRQQGIEVSDAVLDQAIQAQRDKRFVHVAPTGPLVVLAKLWIHRARVAIATGVAVGAVVVSVLLWHVGITMPREASIERRIATVNEWMKELPSEIQASNQALSKAKAQFEQSKIEAGRIANADRLSGTLQTQSAAVASAEYEARQGLLELGSAKPEVVGRETFESRYPALASRMNAEMKKVAGVQASIEKIGAGARQVGAAASTSVLLDAANDQILALQLAPERDAVRANLYAGGAAALAAGNLSQAGVAAKSLGDLTRVFGEMGALRDRALALKGAGLKTGPDADAAKALDSAYARMVGAIDAIDPAKGLASLKPAQAAEGALQDLVSTLSGEYVYRVVNREGVKSGVWRFNTQTPNAKNYYLIVEPVGSSGEVEAIPVRNEESGETVKSKLFGVRVSEAEFERVKADKMDNGLVDRNEIGSKARGRLSPSFSVDVTGGYITQW